MEITQIRVFPVAEDKLKAFVSIIFDDCFVVSDIKIIDGPNGLFVSMPSKKRKNGTFRDIAHPLNSDTRRRIEQRIIDEYRDVVMRSGDEVRLQLRDLDEEAPPRAESARTADFAATRMVARPRGDEPIQP